MAARNTSLDLRALLPQVKGKHGVKAGVLKDATNDQKHSKASIAEYAMYNEYGTKRIPARPFMRETMDTYAEKVWLPELSDMICVDGLDPRTAMARLGEIMVAHIRQTINESPNWAVPNTEYTKAHKTRNQNTPLVDTNSMHDAIACEVLS